MKIKPADKNGGVIMELGPKEQSIPTRSFAKLPSVLPAFKLKKILVPVDFSECTKEALLYAVPFAKQFDAEVTLLHVVEPSYLPPPEIGGPATMETVEDAGQELERLRDQLAREVRCKAELRTGGAEYEIIAAAKELGSDLIIVSTHGRTGLAHLLMGSTAERVLRHAGCPLLVVRENEHEFVTEETANK